MVVIFGAAPALLSWSEEKEESDPVQIADSPLSFGSALTGGLECLEGGDGDRADSGISRILFPVSRDLSSQAKVELAQRVVPRFDGPHSC